MDTINRSIQTAFRFRPELLSQIKSKARLEGKSVNAFVESVIEDYLAKDDDRYEALFRQIENLKPSNPIKLNFPEPMAELIFSDEQLDKDSKLAYLVNKHLR